MQDLKMDKQSDFETLRDVFNRVLNAGELKEQAIRELQEMSESLEPREESVDVFDTYISIQGVKLPIREDR